MRYITRIRQTLVLGLVAAASASVALAAAGTTYRLAGRLTSGGALSGKIVFIEEVRQGVRQSLKIEMQGAQPNQELPVLINGDLFMTLKSDDFGRAKVELREGGDNPGQSNVPDLKAGHLISVGAANSIMIVN